METELIIEKFKEKFNSEILEIAIKNQKRMIITINPDSIIKCCCIIYTRLKDSGLLLLLPYIQKEDLRFIIISARMLSGLILNIHVILDKDNPQIESLSNMFNASNWIEREMHELFGINFLNHPNQEKLISEGNWAEGVYPMRKEIK